jgi:hypothetical protein
MDLTKRVADILLQNSDSLATGVRQIIASVDHITPALRLVYSACFRATRRKYKEKLLPIITVSSFLMLRFLLPQFAMMGPEASKLGQKMMNIFVFKVLPEIRDDKELPKLIGDFLLEISKVLPGDVALTPGDNTKILQFCAENAPMLAERLEIAKAEDEHPLHWSVLELLETGIFGVREDYTSMLEGKAFVLDPRAS